MRGSSSAGDDSLPETRDARGIEEGGKASEGSRGTGMIDRRPSTRKYQDVRYQHTKKRPGVIKRTVGL